MRRFWVLFSLRLLFAPVDAERFSGLTFALADGFDERAVKEDHVGAALLDEFSDTVSSAGGDASDINECNDYIRTTGCKWTIEWSCPGQPQGSGGSASKPDLGFKCCCHYEIWKKPHLWLQPGRLADEQDAEPEKLAAPQSQFFAEDDDSGLRKPPEGPPPKPDANHMPPEGLPPTPGPAPKPEAAAKSAPRPPEQCMADTGGTCSILMGLVGLKCDESRNAKCDNGKCVCNPGFCNLKGKCVLKGTVRRLDFVEDIRFSKYRLMKQQGKKMCQVKDRLARDEEDLLMQELTEQDLSCFLRMLFGEVTECSVSPSYGEALDAKFLRDKRIVEFVTMRKLQSDHCRVCNREKIESAVTRKQLELVAAGLNEAQVSCIVPLVFNETEECSAVPAGKVIGLDFLQRKELFKFRMMKKVGTRRIDIKTRIILDKEDLKHKGLTDGEIECIIPLLFEEVTECQTGPKERVAQKSPQEKSLDFAVDTKESLLKLMGDDAPPMKVVTSLSWATNVFEVTVPPKITKKEDQKMSRRLKKDKKGKTKAQLLDGRLARNLNILLFRLPKPPYDAYFDEISARGESSLEKEQLEIFARAVAMVDDDALEAVRAGQEHISQASDKANHFVQSMLPYWHKETSISDIVQCMVRKQTIEGKLAEWSQKAAVVETFYNKTARLADKVADTAAGFVAQLLQARIETHTEGDNLHEYDKMLRKMRDASDEDAGSIVPLLVVYNLLFSRSARVRSRLYGAHQDLATDDDYKYLVMTYGDVFMAYYKELSKLDPVSAEIPGVCREATGIELEQKGSGLRQAKNEAEAMKRESESCIANMPGKSGSEFEGLRTKAKALLQTVSQVQETVVRELDVAMSHFMPRTSDGSPDQRKINKVLDILPTAGSDDDWKRIVGEYDAEPKFRMLELADELTFRSTLRRFCEAFLNALPPPPRPPPPKKWFARKPGY